MTDNIIKIKKDEPIDVQLESDSILKNGYGLISRDIMRDKNIHPTAKAIYAYLNSFAGSKGICFPTLSLIQEELNLSKNTVDKYMRELRQHGLIKVFRMQNEETNLLSNNVYEIAMTNSKILENKKNALKSAKNKNVPNQNNSSSNVYENSIPQSELKYQDKIKELLNTKIFSIEELSKMSIEKINQAYELINRITK